MKGSEPSDENLGLFADVISGTLGIVALIALILALSALDWNGLSVAGPHTMYESAALENHLETARAARRASEETAETEITNTARQFAMDAASVWSAAEQHHFSTLPPTVARPDIDVGTDVDALRVRENLLLSRRIAETDVTVAALDRLLASLAERQQRASAEFVEHYGQSARVLRESDAGHREPLYLICRGETVYATRLFQGATLMRNNEDLSWMVWDDGSRSRCFPREGHGWTFEMTREQLQAWAPALSERSEVDVVLLVQPDAYALARDLLGVLAPTEVSFSWMPYQAGDQIDFSVDGRVPPGPL